jgi:hypothetical protein
MKLNLKEIEVGDVFFTRSFAPVGIFIQLFTGFGNPTHVGKIIRDKEGVFKTIEMIADFKKYTTKKIEKDGVTKTVKIRDTDLISRPLTYYTKWWRFWVKIIAIKRAPEFIFVENKLKFAELAEKYLSSINDYDLYELLTFVFNVKDKSKKMICSRFVYEIDKICNVDFKDKDFVFSQRVSPADLYKCKSYYLVKNWRKKSGKQKNRFCKVLHR